MSEFRFENTNPEHAISSQLWPIFDILRNDQVSPNDYYVVLFLLSAYRRGGFHADFYEDPQIIRNYLQPSNFMGDLKAYQYPEIFDVFESSLNQISDKGLRYIFNLFAMLSLRDLDVYFPVIFDSLLYRIAKSQGRYGGLFIQPFELSRLLIKLANLKPGAKVYNPFAGVASFGVFLTDQNEYFGQEISSITWAIGRLRLIAYEKRAYVNFIRDNSIAHWNPSGQQFDLIISNPPFNVTIGDKKVNGYEGYPNIEQFLIRKGVSSLSSEGKLIIVVPNGLLTNVGFSYQHLREFLIELDYIDTVIFFPSGLLPNTGIPFAVLILNKVKRHKGMITFVDAKKYIETNVKTKEKRLNDEALMAAIQNADDETSVRLVSNQQVREHVYNLNVPRYFQKEVEGVRLSEIAEFVQTTRVDGNEKVRLVRIRDLKDDKFDFILDESSVEETSTLRPYFRMVHESSLLLAVRWRTLKPTLFKYKGSPIAVPNDIVALKIDEGVADIGYLINELHADYIEEQLASYRIGETIPAIRRDDLMKVNVELLPIKEQIAKVQGLTELSNRLKSLQAERNALVYGKSASRFNEFASLKHTLGRPRQNILDWSDNLLHFLISNNAEAAQLNKAFAEFYDIDMIAALQEIKRDINLMSEVLEKGEKGLVLEDHPLELLPLSEINSLVNGITHNGFKFKIMKLLLKGEKLKERGVEANRILLKTLIDNVLTNANKHGFKSKETANEVVIELTEVEDLLILEIRNNGQPFPKNFDKQKFISKYTTADPENGTGLGGYDINRIAEYFNNPDWELVLNEDPIYPVKLRFQLPIKFFEIRWKR